MTSIKEITKAINDRCKVAMKLAGYDHPQISSLNTDRPVRPGCITHINTKASVEASGEFVRTVDVLVMFFPEDEQRPYDELKLMDDCMTRAFLNPISVDGYRKLPNEDGIEVTVDIDHDILDVVLSYDFEMSESEISLENEETEYMESLLDSYEEG